MPEETLDASQDQTQPDQQTQPQGHSDDLTQDRFNQVYGKFKGAERENNALQETIAEQNKRLEQMESLLSQNTQKPLTPEAFDYDEDALMNARLDQVRQQATNDAMEQFQKTQQANTMKQQQDQAINSYLQKANDYGNQNPEFVNLFEQAANAGIQLKPEIGEVLTGLDNGPAIHHELLKNPALLNQLNSMPANLATYQLGQIANNIKPQVSAAPDPIDPIQGGGVNKKAPSNMEEYAAKWKGLPSRRR